MGKKNPSDWHKAYRLTLVEDQSHKRIRTWHFSVAGAAVTLITAVVVLGAAAWSLIAFTPLRTSIPGYPDAHFKRDAIANALKIDSLENEMTRWALYAGNLKRVLSGEQTLTIDSVLMDNTPKYLRKLADEELARQDSLLRGTVAREERFGVSDKKRELPLEGVHFFAPLKGTVSQAFDMVLHPAVDITAPAGSVVSAVLDGTVFFADWTDETGYTISIQHPGGIVSCYKHNQKLLKKTGEKVSAGAPIALVGNTGSLTTGDHLHFELWYNGEAIDPAKYCKF